MRKISIALALALVASPVIAGDKEIVRIERLAKQGNMDAEYRLGLAYRDGTTGKRVDPKKAQAWIGKAAQHGHQDAQALYGIMLYQSDMKSQSEYWLKVAATNGDAKSQYILGLEYWNGGIVEKDSTAAERFLKMASDQGLEPAQTAYNEVYGILHPAPRKPQFTTGQYLVQLGIFNTEGQAQAAWNRLVDRVDFEGREPKVDKVPLGYALRVYDYPQAAGRLVCKNVKAIGVDCYSRRQ